MIFGIKNHRAFKGEKEILTHLATLILIMKWFPTQVRGDGFWNSEVHMGPTEYIRKRSKSSNSYNTTFNMNSKKNKDQELKKPGFNMNVMQFSTICNTLML